MEESGAKMKIKRANTRGIDVKSMKFFNHVGAINEKLSAGKPHIFFVRITFPMNKILETATMGARVEDRFDFVMFFIVDEIRRGARMRIRM